jgi:hypothetical protein
MDIRTLKSLYAKRVITFEDVVTKFASIEHPTDDPAVWLHLFPCDEAAECAPGTDYSPPFVWHPFLYQGLNRYQRGTDNHSILNMHTLRRRMLLRT